MRVAIVCAFLCISALAQAQLPNEMWHPGRVVIQPNDTLKGKVQYDFKTNTVLVDLGNGIIKTFSSQKVLYFDFNCQYFNRYRYFYVIPYSLRGAYKVPVFFEILSEGPLTLMAREYVMMENYDPSFYSVYRTNRMGYTRERLTYDYFLLTSDGEIGRFEEKRSDLLPYFGKHSHELKKYIKKNKLKVTKQADLVRTVNYYNELVTGEIK